MKTTVKLFANPTTEAQHQINVIRWSMINRAHYPELALLFHIPNGGSRDVREAKHMKEQGVKPGVPDLFLPIPRGKHHGLFLEMKTPTGRASAEQNYWLEQLRARGYVAALCRGWKEAVHMIEVYLEGGFEGAENRSEGKKRI